MIIKQSPLITALLPQIKQMMILQIKLKIQTLKQTQQIAQIQLPKIKQTQPMTHQWLKLIKP